MEYNRITKHNIPNVAIMMDRKLIVKINFVVMTNIVFDEHQDLWIIDQLLGL